MGRNVFVKPKKFTQKYAIFIIFTLKVPRKSFSWVERKTEMPNCIISLPIPTVVETALKALLLKFKFSTEVDFISPYKC